MNTILIKILKGSIIPSLMSSSAYFYNHYTYTLLQKDQEINSLKIQLENANSQIEFLKVSINKLEKLNNIQIESTQYLENTLTNTINNSTFELFNYGLKCMIITLISLTLINFVSSYLQTNNTEFIEESLKEIPNFLKDTENNIISTISQNSETIINNSAANTQAITSEVVKINSLISVNSNTIEPLLTSNMLNSENNNIINESGQFIIDCF